MASDKKNTNDRSAQWKNDKAEKAQSFAAAASASKQEDSSSEEDEDEKDKKAFMKSFMASWKSSKNDKKAHKNKCKRSDNDTSKSKQNNSTSFKLVALKPKRVKIGIPTTEVIGETTVKGSKKPLRILIDTGSSSSIILKKFINKSLLVKNSRTTTQWTTLGGKFYTNKQGTIEFKLPELFLNKTIEFKVHVDRTTVHANAAYYMIIGRYLISELKLVLDVDTQCITWDGINQPMKTQGGGYKKKQLITRTFITL
jgi:predicted aspartyl protease